MDASQNHITFTLTGAGRDQIIQLVPINGFVCLGFFWGVNLPEPFQLLTGTGNRLRHLKVRALKEAGQPGLKDLVAAAWADVEAMMMKKKPK